MPTELDMEQNRKNTKIVPIGSTINQISDINMHSGIEGHYAIFPNDEEEEKCAKKRKIVYFIDIAFDNNHRIVDRDQTIAPLDTITIDSKEVKESKEGRRG
jgi:hypothetical protein